MSRQTELLPQGEARPSRSLFVRTPILHKSLMASRASWAQRRVLLYHVRDVLLHALRLVGLSVAVSFVLAQELSLKMN